MNTKRRPEDFLPIKSHGVEIKIDRMSKRIRRIEKNIKSAVSLGGTNAEKDAVFSRYNEPRDRITLLIPPNVTGEELVHWRSYNRIFLEDLHKSVYFDEETPEMKIIRDEDGTAILVRLINIARKREMSKVEDHNIHLDEDGKSWAEIATVDEETLYKILNTNV